MKKISKVILFMLLMVVSFSPAKAIANSLSDLETSEYKMEIEKLIEDGVIHGYTDGTFKPESNITRGEYAKVLVAALNLEESPESADHFTDVKGKWNQGYVGALYKANLMVGVSNDKFGQDNNVTRQEMAVILTRVYGFEDIANGLALESEFADANSIGKWAKNAVTFAYEIGLIQGMKNDGGTVNFAPIKIVDRQLVSKLVYELKYNQEAYKEKINTILEEAIVDENKSPEDKDNIRIDKGNTGTDKDSSKDPVKEDKDKVDDKPSYDSIVSKYKSQLSSLESSISSELSSLISKAKSEYLNSTTPAGEIMSKYMELAYSLEASADSEVSSTLSSLSNELNSHGYDTSVISDLESEYQDSKSDLRNSILP